MEQKSVSLQILFSKFSFTTRLTLEVPRAEGRLINSVLRIWLSRYGPVGRYCGYEHARQISDLQSGG